MELCPQLDISIPVGKDSLSMQAQWHDQGEGAQERVAGVAGDLGVRAGGRRAPALTPLLDREVDSELWLIGLGPASNAWVVRSWPRCMPTTANCRFAGAAPDLDDPQRLRVSSN